MLKQRETSTMPRAPRYVQVDNTAWKDIFRTAQIPIDGKTRDFQYRFLYDILFNNYWLFNSKTATNALSATCIY